MNGRGLGTLDCHINFMTNDLLKVTNHALCFYENLYILAV